MNTDLNIERVLTESKNLNMAYIENIASKELSDSEFNTQTQEKYNFLYEGYEPIFKISTSQNYDFTRLKFMLEMAKKVQKDEISEHNASVQVGQVLVDQIVKPQLDNAGIKPDKK
jgi:hypothetical protein